MKLLKEERSIGIYDNITEEKIEDVIINVTIEDLNHVVVLNEDDPLYYDGYVLSETQLQKLSKYSDKGITPNFVDYYYVLQCLGIYDWDTK